MVFFRKYLGDIVQEKGDGVPLLTPPMYTINDFFYSVYRAEVTDRLKLLLELYVRGEGGAAGRFHLLGRGHALRF